MSRGRGRGQLSFNAELLGVGRGEAPTSALAPPPKYPPRPGRTIPLLENPEQDYLLAVGKEFRLHMRSSPFCLKAVGGDGEAPAGAGTSSGSVGGGAAGADKKSVHIERYSDRYESTTQAPLDLDWERFPRELRPEYRKKVASRKRKATTSKKFKPKISSKTDVSKTLEELEKKEKEEGEGKGGEGGTKKGEGGSEDDDEEDEDKTEEGAAGESDLEEVDEEMDDGTDYANNYFDNGERYLDEEDDNLDEGGIY